MCYLANMAACNSYRNTELEVSGIAEEATASTPCRQQPAHSYYGEYAGVRLNTQQIYLQCLHVS